MLKKLYALWRQKSQRDLLLDAIGDARLFEEWEAAAYKLDEVLDYDMWYVDDPTSHETHHFSITC
jgi:TAG lipase/lysophosphatidylethanolamine acyltransferase